ncbi:peptidylprolyl isomerase [Sunxiuqinia elliptica]|uniref:Peptidyl-prolyl cis-trans isomerase n=1 Tax=Sunxiuqinia elliptica TaxID=655355 RepID=A0A1I2JBV4_9BACT|nr:FKBP-type peptidyl-prolyl cis-trans isomerase [Sunxiuqinia elliptica]TDN98898.1 FKBP-type peptidyl-prolyl cis-trans isomerase SlyD [Sunxiuqinia elliptica]TDO56339.1 FKBP-type peptidyl-prolyl cis-trans isomerase SlyD [Sunxiuqinia elliptica]SFF51460.1 FKBP-type peptidyl-prolyl cis-trans isomerase SlyD [Sunxiuqinia elliptica]
MAITKNTMVSLTYDLKIEGANGELIEQATAEKPLTFVYGAGLMLPKFEALIEGLEQGNDFNINLPCEDAYGQVDENAIVDLPKHLFMVEGKFDEEIIKVGNIVPMMSAGGQRMNGLVLEITEEHVKMDFNHPLAGEDLFFSGKVLEVRDATDEEIAATLQSGCGCDSGGCGCEETSCETEGANGGGCGCGC